MKNLIIKHARWIGWVLLGVYILLIGIGLTLQSISGMLSAGAGIRDWPIRILLVSWVIVGVLLVSRQPRHPIGWIFATMPILFVLEDFAGGYAYYGSVSHPGSLPFVELAIVYTYWGRGVLAATWLTFLFLLFPTGRLMSRRWGTLARVSILATIIYVLSATIAPLPLGVRPFPTDLIGRNPDLQSLVLPLTFLSFFGIVLCTFLAIFSLYLRLRRATGVERQQLKWFVFSSVFFIPGVTWIFIGSIQNSPLSPRVYLLGILLLGTIVLAGIPIASTIAILRYHLWDIDIIIRRTLIYGILTGLLVLIYFLSVTLLQNAATSIMGQTSPVVIVLSTLGIAALFTPLRSRIQNFIDRRFYRTAYNADRILQEFAITAREEFDVDALAREVLEVIDSTMQPKTSSLGLKTD